MSPDRETAAKFWARRQFLGLGLVALGGCTSPLIRAQSPAPLQDLAAEETQQGVLLVGDYCGGWGLEFKKLESIALVTNLDNTGSDPPPGPAREKLLAEMQGRDVKDPAKVLESPRVSLVQVTAFIPPACQKGEVIDVVVRVPKRSTTTSLRGGWLMQCRLREMIAIGGSIKQGPEAGLAQGHVIVDSIFSGSGDQVNEVRGRVLGGGVSGQTRKFGLMVRRDDVSIETTSVIGAAVNQRFHTFDRGRKRGVAEPKDATYVELLVPSRYKHNLGRYIAVVRSIGLRETSIERARRLEVLEQKLLEPTTSAKASLQLEAIGKDAIPILKKGLESPDREIRFQSAEALAYLEEPAAAKPLAEVAREELAFRWAALAALTSIDHVQAYEALSDLLHVESAETRYGAFRAMRLRNPNDPTVKGERLGGGQFTLHLVPSLTEPMIHISKQERAEIVLFGQDLRMRPPRGIHAGRDIILTSADAEQVKISRFVPNEEDRVAYSSMSLEQIIRAIASVGGTYGDVVQAVSEAKQAGLLDARVAVDAVARPGRMYYRSATTPRDDESSGGDLDSLIMDNAFTKKDFDRTPVGTDANADGKPKSDDKSWSDDELIAETYVNPKYSGATKKGVWSRLTGWFSGSSQ